MMKDIKNTIMKHRKTIVIGLATGVGVGLTVKYTIKAVEMSKKADAKKAEDMKIVEEYNDAANKGELAEGESYTTDEYNLDKLIVNNQAIAKKIAWAMLPITLCSVTAWCGFRFYSEILNTIKDTNMDEVLDVVENLEEITLPITE